MELGGGMNILTLNRSRAEPFFLEINKVNKIIV